MESLDTIEFIKQSNAVENYYLAGTEVPDEFKNWGPQLYTTSDPQWLGHVAALEHVKTLGNLRVSDVLDLHGILCEGLMPAGHSAGEFRKMSVRIGNNLAPQPDNIGWMMERLLDAPDRIEGWTDWDLHAAFEVIHPFRDGNGRLGRILWAWWLYQPGVSWESALKVATVDNLERRAYYDRIQRWRMTKADTFFDKPICIL